MQINVTNLSDGQVIYTGDCEEFLYSDRGNWLFDWKSFRINFWLTIDKVLQRW